MLHDRMDAKHCISIYNFIQEHNIKTVVETGIKHGMSSFFILSALPKDGLLISVEPELINVLSMPLWANWMIVNGTSNAKLEWLFTKFPKVDLFLHDSLHTYGTMKFEYELALKHCRYLASHDIDTKEGKVIWEETVSHYKLKELIHMDKFAIAEVSR